MTEPPMTGDVYVYDLCSCGHPDFAHMRTASIDDLDAVTRPCADCSCTEYLHVFTATVEPGGEPFIRRVAEPDGP